MSIFRKAVTYRIYSYFISFGALLFLTRAPARAAGLSLAVELFKFFQYSGFEYIWESAVEWHRPLAPHLVLKSLLYRCVAFGLAFFLFALLTGQVTEATKFAGVTEFIKLFQYYVFDRLWRALGSNQRQNSAT